MGYRQEFMAPDAMNAFPDQSETVRRCRGTASSDLDLCQGEAEPPPQNRTHESKAGANPREERSLFGEIFPHVSPAGFDGRLSFLVLTPANRGRNKDSIGRCG